MNNLKITSKQSTRVDKKNGHTIKNHYLINDYLVCFGYVYSLGEDNYAKILTVYSLDGSLLFTKIFLDVKYYIYLFSFNESSDFFFFINDELQKMNLDTFEIEHIHTNNENYVLKGIDKNGENLTINITEGNTIRQIHKNIFSKEIFESKILNNNIDFQYLNSIGFYFVSESNYVVRLLINNVPQIMAYHKDTAKLVWSKDVRDWFIHVFDAKDVIKNKVFQLNIFQDLVISGMFGHIIAFDIETGTEVWRCSLGQKWINSKYFFILDEEDELLWVITAISLYRGGKLKCINLRTGDMIFEADKSWEDYYDGYPFGCYNWYYDFSMNKNFIFLTFDGSAIAVMDKKTGAIVEWFHFTKRKGETELGNKLKNKTLYQPTNTELFTIDVSAYFIDGDEYEKNSMDNLFYG
jgi:outer membrane protein assembly factor BamB